MSKQRPLTKAERDAIRLAGDPLLVRMLEEERVESEELDTELLIRLIAYARPHLGLALIAVVLSAVESLFMTVPAYMVGLVVDRVSGTQTREANAVDRLLDSVGDSLGVAPTNLSDVVLYLSAIVAAAWVIRWVVAMASGYAVQMLGQRVVHDLRVDVYRHITSMGLDYFQTNPVGRLVNRTTFDVQALSELFSDAFAQGLRDVSFVLVLTGVMFALDAGLAAILVASFPLLFGIAILYRVLARASMRTRSAVQSRMNAWLAENVSGMRENQLYRREERRRKEFRALTDAHQSSVSREIRAWALMRPTMMGITAVTTSIILFWGHEQVVAGVLTVGVLLTFLQYVTRLWVPIRNLTQKVTVIQTALTAGERIFDVLSVDSSMTDNDDADPALEVRDGSIRFEDVRFRYATSPADVLRGISFEVSGGQTVALVGDTGAGKSTIVSLLSRFYDPTSGRVLVDGRDARRYTLSNLRRAAALVPQDVVIFAGTIRDNVTLGIEASDEEVWACIEAACASELVRGFEDGLDHELEEGGRTLSVGERQLLSFARALLADPPILVLDEATANIDSRTEQLIQRALGELTKGRTTVVIAHRLSTIRDADQILVLRDGGIVESGTHAELLAANGEYKRLCDAHFSNGEATAARPL